MTKSQKKSLFLIIITSVLLLLCIFFSHFINNTIIKATLFAIPYITIGLRVFIKSFKRLKSKDFMDENFLMTIASIGAFILGEYIEGVAVLLFYAIGELFENVAVGKSRKSISDLMDICPEYANIERDGNIIKVDPYEVNVGDTVIVKPGERVPLDGVVTEGKSSLDTAALTGESLPRDISAGDNIYSGCINLSGMIKIQTTKQYSDSTVSKILELVENSALAKSKSENFISQFAKYYTPCVVAAALIIATIPPAFLGNFAKWIQKALVFLVVSCPCALVISVPLSFFAGIGAASKAGILIKGSTYIERLAKTGIAVFDKTGTLTKGTFEVTEVNSNIISPKQLLEVAAKVEFFSDHPIAISIKKAYGIKIDTSDITNLNEISGCGISAKIGNDLVLVGNKKLMEKYNIPCSKEYMGTVVYVAKNSEYLGNIIINDKIKDKSEEAIKMIKHLGVQKTIMLTGDKKDVARSIAKQLGIDTYHYELFPEDKVNLVEKYIEDSQENVIFTGDGINDAPVLARADVGIAMGAIGSDSAIEAADIVLMDDNLHKIPLAIRISKKTMRIVKQNIVFSIGIKLIVMILSVIGYANLWLGVFADVGVSVIAILNAIRCFRLSKKPTYQKYT